MHSLEPEKEKVPAGHFRHATAVVAPSVLLNVPFLHVFEQWGFPLLSSQLPIGHKLQVTAPSKLE